MIPIPVAETGVYLASARQMMSEDEISATADFLARNAGSGDVIKGTGGLRKVRVPLEGRGKSGGTRIVYFYHDDDMPLYAWLIYGKGQQADMSAAQKKAAMQVVQTILKRWGR